jgi:threonyl-tRNA synthetase
VAEELRESGLRAEVDARSESIGKKIREAEVLKVPYMLVVGDKEQEADQVAVRRHREGDIGAMATGEFAEQALHEIAERR